MNRKQLELSDAVGDYEVKTCWLRPSWRKYNTAAMGKRGPYETCVFHNMTSRAAGGRVTIAGTSRIFHMRWETKAEARAGHLAIVNTLTELEEA